MTLRSLLLASFLWVMYSGLLYAEGASQLIVKDTEGKALPAVQVQFLDSKGTLLKTLLTNREGTLGSATLPEGTATLTLYKRGFGEKSVTPKDFERSGEIVLEPVAFSLSELVVSASRREEKTLNAPASIGLVSSEELLQEAFISPEVSLRRLAGVDVQTGGVDRRHVSIRGFSHPLLPTGLLMSDYRHTFLPTVNVNSFANLHTNDLDIERIEVVRGPGSALYGPGADVGVIHVITKNPFDYQGTSVQIGGGNQATGLFAFRHAEKVSDNFAYKITARGSTARDWELDPNDSLDAAEIAKQRFERDLDTWKYSIAGSAVYRFSPETELSFDAGISSAKYVTLSAASAQLLDDYRLGFGQVRFRSGGLFVQAYANAGSVDNWVQYSNGVVFQDRSWMYNIQGQYEFDFAFGSLVVGGDYRVQNPVTRGTLTGRNEGNATVAETGLYFQSDIRLIENYLKLTLGGRLDNNSALEVTEVSPRAALVYTPDNENSVRLSYNRALNSPTPLNIFLDISAARLPAPGSLGGNVNLQLRGGWEPLTFAGTAGNRVGTSLLDTVGFRQTGVGLDYRDAFLAILRELAENPAFADLLPLLSAMRNDVEGFVPGEMRMPGSATAIDDPLPIANRQQPTITQMYEIGYQGVIANKVFITADVYYADRQNFIGPAEQIAPYIFAPNFSKDNFRDALIDAFNRNPDLLAGSGLSAQELADQIMSGGAATLNALGSAAVGIVQPQENTVAGERPELVLGYRNFGRVRYWGVDIGVEAEVTDGLRLFGALSWLSQNDFTAEDLGETNPLYSLPLNVPQLRLRGGFMYTLPSSLTLGASVRYQDEFRVAIGSFRGMVPSFTIFDATVGYDFSDFVEGLRLDLSVQNLFNTHYREFVGTPALGRYGVVRATYSF